MKLANIFIAATVALFGFTAHASLQPEGTFVPDLCGTQSGFVGQVQAVCIGSKVGDNGRTVQFRMNDKTVRSFKVEMHQNLMVAIFSGKTKSIITLVDENGARATMKVIEDKDGEITAASGQLDNGVGYFVPKFEKMAVIQ